MFSRAAAKMAPSRDKGGRLLRCVGPHLTGPEGIGAGTRRVVLEARTGPGDARFLFGGLIGRNIADTLGEEPGIGADRRFDRLGDIGILLEEILGVLASLADPLAVIGVPRARFFDDASGDAKIDELARFRDTLAIHDIELDLLEGRRHLVLDDLDPRLVADHFVAILDLSDAADIETDGSVEFERIAARSGFGRAEHDADLHADLVDEDHHALR